MVAASRIKIGVFDSGMGGLSVAQAIENALPSITYEVIFRNDSEHVPYGSKPVEEVRELVVPIFQQMINEGCEVIVVACNTVTTTLIRSLRRKFPVPLIGIEPMVKPAAKLSRSGIIAVCATPTTLTSPRYSKLKAEYASDIRVLEPDCSDWASMIEHDTVDDAKVAKRINSVISQGADVIVLACTHYHWIEERISHLARDKATVLQPEQAIIRELKRKLASL